MDISELSIEELDALTIAVFEERARREHRVSLLDELSNPALEGIIRAVFEILEVRYKKAEANEREAWEKTIAELLVDLFPEIIVTYRQDKLQRLLIRHISSLVEPLQRKGKKPKSKRNEIIHKCLEQDKLNRAETYAFLIEHHPELMKIGKRRTRLTSAASIWPDYNKWLSAQPKND